jgi:hypothetical protein
LTRALPCASARVSGRGDHVARGTATGYLSPTGRIKIMTGAYGTIVTVPRERGVKI